MTRRYLSGGLAFVSLAAIFGCDATRTETPEDCVERFGTLLAASPGDARFQPIFTYDVTRMKDVLETFAGDADKRAGLRMTISHGPSDAALTAFYEADVPPQGAIFAADDFSLFRRNGTPGPRDETLLAGCRGAPEKARLVHVQWNALPSAAEDRAARAR
jgi:hypothetical protein